MRFGVFLNCRSGKGLHLDQGGIGLAEGEGIAVYHHFHRVAQGGELHQFDDGIGDEAHVEKMLPALSFAVHSLDGGGFSYI